MKLFLFVISAMLTLNSYGQDLIPFIKDGLYGFAKPNGEVTIEPQFDNVTNFGSSRFLLKEQKDIQIYGSLKDIPWLKLAHVKIDSLWTLIDIKGNMVLPCTSKRPLSVTYLLSSYSVYRDFIDKEANKHVTAVKINNTVDGLWRIFYVEDQSLSTKIYKELDRSAFRSGIWKPQPKYKIARSLEAKLDLIDGKDGRLILKDLKKLQKICSTKYYYEDSLSQWYIYDTQTKNSSIVPFPIKKIYQDFTKPHEDNCHYDYLAIKAKSSNKAGLVDNRYNLIIDTAFTDILVYPNHFVARNRLQYNGNYQISLFDLSGNPLDIPECLSLSPTSHNLIIAKLISGKYVLLDRRAIRINEKEYDGLHLFDQQSIFFKKNDKAGLLSLDGNIKLEYPCEKIYPFQREENESEEIISYRVERDSLQGLITNDGETLYPVKFRNIKNLYLASYLMLTNAAGKRAIGNNKGEILTSFMYDDIKKEYAQNSKYHLVCYINEKEHDRFDDKLEPTIVQPKWLFRYPSPYKLNNEKTKGGQVIVNGEGKQISDTTYAKTYRFLFGGEKCVGIGVHHNSNKLETYNCQGEKKVFDNLKLYLDPNRKDPVSLKYIPGIMVQRNDKMGILSADREFLIPPNKYKYITEKHSFISAVRIEGNKSYTTLFDLKLNKIYDDEFTDIEYFGSKYFLASIPYQEKDTISERYGLIDKEGKVIFPFEYHKAYRIPGLVLSKLDAKGQINTQLFNRKHELIFEGPYDYIQHYDYKTKKVFAITGDYWVTIEADGTKEIKPISLPVEGTKMYIKMVDGTQTLFNGNDEKIVSEKEAKAIVSPNSIRKLMEDRFLFQQQNKILILNKAGKILAEEPCYKLWSRLATLVPLNEDGSFPAYPISIEEEQKLLDQKLIKLEFDEEVFFFNFETLIKFKIE